MIGSPSSAILQPRQGWRRLFKDRSLSFRGERAKMAILIALLALCLATSSGAQPISAESAEYHDLDAGELVAEGNVEVLSHLVALKEVDPNRRTRTGSTLLCVAVEQGNSEIAALLLQAGAKVETRDSKTGHTPLCIAALAKNTEMAKLLLSYGASPDDRSASGRSPRIIANEEKDVELLKVIEVFDQSGAAAFEDPPGTWLAFSEGNHRYYQVSRGSRSTCVFYLSVRLSLPGF